jgi:hypothetical protein
MVIYRFEPTRNELSFVVINNNFRIHNCYSLKGGGDRFTAPNRFYGQAELISMHHTTVKLYRSNYEFCKIWFVYRPNAN